MSQSYDFPSSYGESRRAFCQRANEKGFRLVSYPIDAKGPNGEELTIDVAVSPSVAAGKVLVLSSGLHGVEGFFGAAAQLRFLNRWVNNPSIRCILIHAMNPYGFAWKRRFNEDNIDLNRNFLLRGQQYSGSPIGYQKLDSLLNPQHPPARWELFLPKAILLVARYGLRSLQQSIAAGQYEFPKGIFFGGKQAAKTNQILSVNLKNWIGQCEHAIHLDFHTGLGRSACWKLLIDYTLSAAQKSFLTTSFGAGSFITHDAQDRSYDAKGELGSWCAEQNLAPSYLYACAEFGTYSPLTVLRALRAENQAHQFGTPNAAGTMRAKQKLVEAFCPSSIDWRRRVAEACDKLISNAVKGLSELH